MDRKTYQSIVQSEIPLPAMHIFYSETMSLIGIPGHWSVIQNEQDRTHSI